MNKARKITHLKNFVRHTTFATHGLASFTLEEASQLVQSLVDLGKLEPEQGTKLLDRLSDRLNLAGQKLRDRIDKATVDLLDRLEQTLVAELDDLEQRLCVLDQRTAVHAD